MAERRMFAKTIIDSDAFVDMPLSTQALYFHLSMRADDDGFINNPKKIQRMIGASDDDLKMLIAKRFIIPFESGIVVIKHWKIHNYIRGDRKKDTVYPEEMALLTEKENGAYSLITEEPALLPQPNETARQKAYRESTLPYSFEYKIRQAFIGEICPVCGFPMRGSVDECGVASDIRKPSIQHNIPISKGGKHELGNISVICHNCNVTLRDTETGSLNADEVIRKWDEICMSGKCQSSDGQVTGKCQRRLGKVSLDKDSLVEGSVVDATATEEDKLKCVGGKLGKGVVYLSDKQFDDLLERLGMDAFNRYVERLADFIIDKNAHVHNHHEMILKWYYEDSALKPVKGNNKSSGKKSSPSFDIEAYEKLANENTYKGSEASE